MDAAYFNPETSEAWGKGDVSTAPQPVLHVHLDTQSTTSSLFTSNKTTSRAHYEAARSRVGLKDRNEPQEVILYNENGEVMEGSFRNVAFWRDGGWVSPANSSGGLPGTVRRWLIEQDLLKVGVIHKEDIHPGDCVLLTNGIDVTILGRMVGA